MTRYTATQWRAIFAANPTAGCVELAEITGRNASTVCMAAKRLGVTLKDTRSERMRAIMSAPEERERRFAPCQAALRACHEDEVWRARASERAKRLARDGLTGFEVVERRLISRMDDEAIEVYLDARSARVGLRVGAELAFMDMEERGKAVTA